MAERRCAETGLWLVSAPMVGRRVASEAYGPLLPLVRASGPRSQWNRYDTLGSTVYVAETPLIAFLEMLSVFAVKLGAPSSLQTDADAIGLSVQEFVESIAADWKDQGFYGAGRLPPEWVNKRSIYAIQLTGPGWWVDVEHPESISAVRNNLGNVLRTETGLDHLDTGVLRGEFREVTTRIASWVRTLTLDDGTAPVGIRYGSKHGGGHSWAYWLRRKDEGLGEDRIVANMGNGISVSTPGLTQALELLNLQM